MKDKAKFGIDNTIVHTETAVLVALITGNQSQEQTNEYIDEMEF